MQLNNALVTNVTSNPGKGRFASTTFHTVKVQTDTGSLLTLDWGSKAPPLDGTRVSVEIDDAPNYGKYKVRHTPGPMTARSMGGSVAGGPVSASYAAEFPIPEDSRQQSIIRQNSLGHAVDLIKTFPENFGIHFADGGTTTEALTSADDLIKRVVEVAFALSEFSSGKLETDVKETLASKFAK